VSVYNTNGIKNLGHLLSIIAIVWVSIASATADTSPPDIQNVTQQKQHPIAAENIQQQLASIISNEKRSLEQQGFIPVSNEEAHFYTLDNLSRLFGDARQVTHDASFKLSSINSTPPMVLQGMIGYSPTRANQIFTVIRVFRQPNNVTVALEETDFVSAGMQVTHAKAFMNTDISGQPGTITYRRSSNGLALILVSWLTDSKLLKLSMVGPGLTPEAQNVALTLARSVTE